MNNALEIRDLTKRFDGFTLDGLNLTLPAGCIMGFIGENGAGKTTTLKLILNMIRKDAGSIRVLGRDHLEAPAQLREELGVVMGEAGLPDCLSARQAGRVMAGIYQTWDDARYESLLERFSLPRDKSYKDFSRGMRMKLSIAIAMSHDSRLLLLDEPTSGLDPVVRDEVVEMFGEFTRQEDHSILISSHIVSDLEKICDYIAFLHEGKLMLCEEKDVLLEQYGLLHCSGEQLSQLDPDAVRYRKESPYGAEALVLRDRVPAGLHVSPVSIEELFVFMVRGAR